MKRWICLVVLIPTLVVLATKSRAETDKSVVVLGTPLVLKDEKRTADQYLAEYIPEGENFENFNKMFAVWGRLDGTNARFQAKAKIKFVVDRKGKDPLANFNAFHSKDNKMLGLDFLISEGRVLEHNIWTFQDVKGGVLGYQYARRHYQGKSTQSTEEFIREIPSVRNKVLDFLKTGPLPRPQGYQ